MFGHALRNSATSWPSLVSPQEQSVSAAVQLLGVTGEKVSDPFVREEEQLNGESSVFRETPR